jgi:hypothetical protein
MRRGVSFKIRPASTREIGFCRVDITRNYSDVGIDSETRCVKFQDKEAKCAPVETGNFAPLYLLPPINLDSGDGGPVDSAGGQQKQSLLRRAVRPPPHEDRPKAMNLPKNAPLAFRLVTPPSGADDGRSAPASS